MNNQEISIIIADSDCELIARQLTAANTRTGMRVLDKVSDGESAIESIKKISARCCTFRYLSSGSGWIRGNGTDPGIRRMPRYIICHCNIGWFAETDTVRIRTGGIFLCIETI